VLAFNPLTVPVEQFRRALFQGLPPQPMVLAGYAAGGVVAYVVGLMIFQQLRRGFSDVM